MICGASACLVLLSPAQCSHEHLMLEISVGCSFQKPWNLPGPLVWLECCIVGIRKTEEDLPKGKSSGLMMSLCVHRCFLPGPLPPQGSLTINKGEVAVSVTSP